MHRHPARFWTPFVLLLFLAALPAAARPASILDDEQFRTDVRRGLDLLYDMDYAAAGAVFAAIEQRHPKHPVGPLLRALPPWWEVMVDPDDESRDKAFLAAMEEVIERCDRRLRTDRQDLDGLFFKAGAHAFRGRLHADRKHWLRAARDGQKALRYLREVRDRDPDNPDLLLGTGLFHYLADVVPEQHPILKPFARMFPKGDRARGLFELSKAAEQGEFVSAEAAFGLVQIYYLFEKDYASALHYARSLRQRYPNNSLFHVYEGRSFARLNMWGEARRDLLEILDRHAEGRTGYRGDVLQQALYVLGRDEVKWKQYVDALTYLARLEDLPRQSNSGGYKAWGRVYRGMALDALGRREEALHWYRRTLAAGGPDDARDRARGYVKSPYRG
jgi:tetratricopeptide (TPR) repeat protein